VIHLEKKRVDVVNQKQEILNNERKKKKVQEKEKNSNELNSGSSFQYDEDEKQPVTPQNTGERVRAFVLVLPMSTFRTLNLCHTSLSPYFSAKTTSLLKKKNSW
jgi:hypothetical protein